MIIQEAQSDGFTLPISHSCLALDVSRSGYYEWLKRSEKIPAENNESSDLISQIQEIALEFPYYGYRRITAELQNRGYAVNHKRVLRLILVRNYIVHYQGCCPKSEEKSPAQIFE